MSALREALKAVQGVIVTLPTPKKATPKKHNTKPATVTPIRPKQYVNGYEVMWMDFDNEARKVPVIKTKDFMIQFPTKGEDIQLPEGTTKATYDFGKKRVEFYNIKGDLIRYVMNSRHEPLPIPRYMSEIENVEEIFDIDLETGEITSEMKIDVMPEEVHWKLRLQEFEEQQIKNGVTPRVITFKLQKYLKNLEMLRGITVEMLAKPIPKTILDAISYAEKKQAAMSGAK